MTPTMMRSSCGSFDGSFIYFFSASIPYSTVCRTWREKQRESENNYCAESERIVFMNFVIAFSSSLLTLLTDTYTLKPSVKCSSSADNRCGFWLRCLTAASLKNCVNLPAPEDNMYAHVHVYEYMYVCV